MLALVPITAPPSISWATWPSLLRRHLAFAASALAAGAPPPLDTLQGGIRRGTAVGANGAVVRTRPRRGCSPPCTRTRRAPAHPARQRSRGAPAAALFADLYTGLGSNILEARAGGVPRASSSCRVLSPTSSAGGRRATLALLVAGAAAAPPARCCASRRGGVQAAADGGGGGRRRAAGGRRPPLRLARVVGGDPRARRPLGGLRWRSTPRPSTRSTTMEALQAAAPDSAADVSCSPAGSRPPHQPLDVVVALRAQEAAAAAAPRPRLRPRARAGWAPRARRRPPASPTTPRSSARGSGCTRPSAALILSDNSG